MRESKYPGKVRIKKIYVDKLDMEPLLRYMEEARKIMDQPEKKDKPA